MTLRYFSYHAPHFIQADGQFDGRTFYLSAVGSAHGMATVIRYADSLMAPITLPPLPSDVEPFELEAIVEVILTALVVTREDAAA